MQVQKRSQPGSPSRSSGVRRSRYAPARQPTVDPDGHALESIRPGVRIYRAERRLEAYEGRTSMVTRRLRKFLVDGSWDAERIVENVESVA